MPMGMLAMTLVALLWPWPTKLTLKDDELVVRRFLRHDQVLSVRDITAIGAGTRPMSGHAWTSPARRAFTLRSHPSRWKPTSCCADWVAVSSSSE